MTPPPSLCRGHVLYVHMKQSFHCIARLEIFNFCVNSFLNKLTNVLAVDLSKFDLTVYSEFPSTGSRYSSAGFFFCQECTYTHVKTVELVA